MTLREKTIKYLELIKADAVLDEMIEQLRYLLPDFPDLINEAEKKMDHAEYLEMLAETCEKLLDESVLDDLIGFYLSESGQKFLKVNNILLNEFSRATSRYTKKLASKIDNPQAILTTLPNKKINDKLIN